MEVFVFDLDFTVWNTGDTFCSETSPPYFRRNGQLFDQQRKWIRLYPDTLEILEMLKAKGKMLAVASRTHEPEWAKQLLTFFLTMVGLKTTMGQTMAFCADKKVICSKVESVFLLRFNSLQKSRQERFTTIRLFR